MENKSVLLVVLIAALLVTVGLQTVQLVALSSGASAASVSFPAAAKSAGSGSAGASVPTSLQNLPSMVGGC